MKATSSKKGSTCTLTVEGKIDTMTAPELEEAVKSNLPKCDKMIFDFTISPRQACACWCMLSAS